MFKLLPYFDLNRHLSCRSFPEDPINAFSILSVWNSGLAKHPKKVEGIVFCYHLKKRPQKYDSRYNQGPWNWNLRLER